MYCVRTKFNELNLNFGMRMRTEPGPACSRGNYFIVFPFRNNE